MTTTEADLKAPSNPDGVTGRLSNWIYSVDFASIPLPVIERAKYLILDGLACGLVGAKLPWSSRAVKAVASLEANGPCTVIGWGEELRASPMSACLLNGTFIQGFELDDYHSKAPIHTNSVILPALFATVDKDAAVGEPRQIFPGSSFLRAYIIGHEVGPRVGLALHGGELLARGWHSGAVQGPSAAAAAVGAILGLPPRQIEWALGTACTQACGLTAARFGSDGKRMQHAFAARNGLLAAFLARESFTGIEEVYEAPHGGFLDMFSQGSPSEPKSLPEEIASELGTRWEIEADRVKLHAAMAGLHGAIDAVENLQKTYPELLAIESLEKTLQAIVTEHSLPIYTHGGWEVSLDKPLSPTAAQMSMQYVIAAQLVDGQVLMKQFGTEYLNRPALMKLMMKVKPTHNPAFDSPVSARYMTKVTIKLHDGTEMSETTEAPRGVSPAVSNDEIVNKWRLLVKDVLDDERRERIETCVLELDKLEDMSQLTALLASPVACPVDF